LTKENLKLAMQKLGQNINDKELTDMIAKHDTKGEGVLCYEDFAKIFVNLEKPQG